MNPLILIRVSGQDFVWLWACRTSCEVRLVPDHSRCLHVVSLRGSLWGHIVSVVEDEEQEGQLRYVLLRPLDSAAPTLGHSYGLWNLSADHRLHLLTDPKSDWQHDNHSHARDFLDNICQIQHVEISVSAVSAVSAAALTTWSDYQYLLKGNFGLFNLDYFLMFLVM